jgi:hypothetical protein
VAFGFKRLAGRNRRHVVTGDTSGIYEIGQEISDRQYRAYLDKIGKRGSLPAVSAIRDTEAKLETLRRQLEARSNDLDARAAALKLREQELDLEKQLFRRARTDSGQRRYNTVLEAYVRQQRRQGRKITKIEARKSPEFKQIMSDIKGKPNKRRDPNIRDANVVRRRQALSRLGGANDFREQYESLYGPTDQGEFAARTGAAYRGMTATGRSVTIRRRVA